MSAESIVDAIGEFTDRRGVLKRAGVAAMGTAMVFSGLKPSSALAHPSSTHGCNLCYNPGSCSYSCAWRWIGACHTNVGGSSHHVTTCCEGFRSGYACVGTTCSGVNCPWYGGNSPC